MLIDGIRNKKDTAVSTEVSASADWMSRHVIQHAAAFEEAAARKYKKLEAKEMDKEKRELYKWLAEEENSHLNAMKAGLLVSGEEDHIPMTETIASDMPPIKTMLMSEGDKERSSREDLVDAIQGEQAQVQFYEALARHCKIPRLKDTFYALSEAEKVHVDKLRGLLGEDYNGRVD